MIWALLVTSALLVGFWLRWRYKNRRLLSIAAKIPGPPTVPLLGNAATFMCNPEELVRRIKYLSRDYGDVMRFWLGPDLNVLVSNPDDLKVRVSPAMTALFQEELPHANRTEEHGPHSIRMSDDIKSNEVLLSNLRTSTKGPQYKYMADVLGGGILSGSGPVWRKHRKIANPNYGKRAIESYEDVFNAEAELLLKKFRAKTRDSIDEFDIYAYIVQTTSYAVCQTLMGLTKDQTMELPYLHELIIDSPSLYDIVFRRMTKWYLQIDPVFWLSKYYNRQKRFIQMMSEFCNAILSHRVERLKTMEDNSKIDLMKAEDDSTVNTKLSVIDRFLLSQELDDDELVQETFTVFTSSQEASAKISSYILLMLGYHPKCQEKLYTEIRSVIGDKDRQIIDEDLKKMPYLEMVFKEVIRLFPIGAMLQRTITEDITISTGILPAGCSLVAPIYHLHRDERFWPNPDAFDPERFTPENSRLRHSNCYIPFSLGPMDCLGRFFATKLVKTICVRVLQEFQVKCASSYDDLKVVIAISVASVNGFKVTLVPRR